MTAFFDDLAERFGELHADLLKALDGLPAEALDWAPGPETNSVSVLLVHLTGAERYWIGDVALGDASGRVRAAEFEVRELTVEDLRVRVTAAEAYARQALSRFSPADLETTRTSPRDGRAFTVGWCLAHALEHSALHLGQVQLTRQLWEQQARVL